jgi:hypothetical protein
MRYWIHVHYPHPIDASDDVPWFVYLKEKHKPRGDKLAPGDKVLFYETGPRKPFMMTKGGQSPRMVERKKGKSAIVREGEVIAPLRAARVAFREESPKKVDVYTHEVPCESREIEPVISYQRLLEVLEVKTFRPHAGLRELDAQEYEELLDRNRF